MCVQTFRRAMSVKRVFDKILMNQPVVLTSKPGSLEIKIQLQESPRQNWVLYVDVAKISALKRKDIPGKTSFLVKKALAIEFRSSCA